MEKGLTTQEALFNLTKFGKNNIISGPRFSATKLFITQFPTAINALLFFAALFSFFLKNDIDGIFILAILFVNGVFSFFQECRAQKALEKLKEFSVPFARVLRNGVVEEIPTSNVTVGDIVILDSGDQIPADGIITTDYHIEIDESLLTGESLPIIKQLNHEIFKGTFVARGKGHMHVTAVGMQTRLGHIAHALAAIKEPKTPLQIQITKLARVLSLAAIALSLLLLPIGIEQHRSLFPIILLTISIAVAAIPESLPGVITIALAVGTNRLAEKQAIVRKMASIETLGTTQIILTDKTGTLTKNDMTVKEMFLLSKKNFPHLLEACLYGNEAFLTEEGRVIGDKTDGALLIWAQKQNNDYKALIDQTIIIDEYTFDSKTKTISTIVLRNKKIFSYVRGAPEEILMRATLTSSEQKKMQEQVNKFAKQGLRVIGFGYKEESHEKVSRKHAESHLHFLGLLGLYDPPRDNSREAVLDAKQHGVRIVMVTGDNPLTAVTIAKEVGLADNNEKVLTGSDMEKMTNQELSQQAQTVNIFARVSPEDKLRLVTTFQQLGFIVGVTGDGVNDALALEKADVGIAMGEKGSDVAKEAADIVLANDDIFTLVSAIKEGRKIYENIVKSITYLLAGNLAEILFVVIATLINHPLPLLPTQILWINLVTDALPALALASGVKNSMPSLSPRNPKAFLLSFNRILFIFVSAVLISAINLIAFTVLIHAANETIARTISFTILVVFELLLAFIVNKSIKDRLLFWSIAFTIFAQIVISVAPIFQRIFHLQW